MKKFKINRNLSKKFISLSLASIITVASLVGCSNNNKIAFKGDNLKNVSVLTLDNKTIDVVNKVSYCSPRVCTGKHEVYKSVVNNAMFTDDNCDAKSSADYLGATLNKYSIKNTENIISYLTLDEIEKANKNKLTEDDILNIIERILENKNNIVKTKKAN